MDGVFVIKIASVKLFNFINGGSIGDENVSVKLFSFFSGGIIGDHERVCQNFSFINGGSIGDQERVCQTLQLLYWREYWWSRTCLSNSSASLMEVVLVIKNVSVKISASLMEGVLVIKNVSVKLFSFINAGSICDQERVCQTLQLLQRRDYLWPGTCLWNSSASSMDGVLVIKNVSVKLFSFINAGSIGDEERVCQTLQLLYWRGYWW